MINIVKLEESEIYLFFGAAKIEIEVLSGDENFRSKARFENKYFRKEIMYSMINIGKQGHKNRKEKENLQS